MLGIERIVLLSWAAGLALAVSAYAAEKPVSSAKDGLARGENGEWRLEVRQADLAVLLDTIAARTGSKIHYTVLPETPVDATCVGNDAKRLLQCLLGKDAAMAVRQTDNGTSTEEIWIMGSSLAKQNSVSGQCAKGMQVASPADQGKAEATGQWLRQAAGKEPVQRARAIAELANADSAFDGEVKAVLQKALTDKDARIRVQAIAAWASREGEEAAGEQLRQALKDGDVNVRLMALDYIEQDRFLLEQAAQDSVLAVRELAETKLENLNKQ